MVSVAETILAQLGGNKFRAMTGAKNFVRIANDQGLQFDIPRKRVQIVLAGNDLYTLAIYRKVGLDLKPVVKLNGLFADQMKTEFSKATGLILGL